MQGNEWHRGRVLAEDARIFIKTKKTHTLNLGKNRMGGDRGPGP